MRSEPEAEEFAQDCEHRSQASSARSETIAGGHSAGRPAHRKAHASSNDPAVERARAAGATTEIRKIAIVGNHLPRQCGIATFTTDLSDAISAECPALECFVLAMNEAGRRYAYPERVRFEIAATDVASYRRAADFLNVSPVDLVSVQHEYGIFGGRAGSYLFALLRDLRMPIVTTLHTILAEPNPQQRVAMDELTQLSQRLVVMSAHGASLLREVHHVPDDKIDLIPHGIPSLPSARQSKSQLGVEGKSVILTFGLLSPDKGIEHVIDALPAILQRHPDTIYIVLGATHPHVKEHDGETYRVMLENRAQRLGVDSSMIFHNRFVSRDELAEFLSAADIYITPYLKPEQITSGTLAYAVGSGKAVISTPYSYARELLADGRGMLVPWRDPEAIARAVDGLLGDEKKCLAMRARAAAYGRNMVWPQVARSYMHSFERACEDHAHRLRTVFQAKTLAERPLELPEINLDHLGRLSDGTGILQHAAFSVPRYEDGYCVDDNARALLLTTLLQDAGTEEIKAVDSLASRYLAFVVHCFDGSSRRFRNFMSYSRNWMEERGSEDGHGRALWALGAVVGYSSDGSRRSLADSLFHAALPQVGDFTSPRAWAYALLGIDEYLRAFQGDSRVQLIRNQLAERLLNLFRRTSTPSWPWFEERATYCNARLSQALLVSGSWMEHDEMKAAGLASLTWLASVQRSSDGYFAPIGSNGFYEKGGSKASFDQQPVEVHAMVSACLVAQRVTGDGGWALEARRAFNWFLGQNQLQQPVYDPATGGCRDGLHADRPNENQGAESTLSFLLALVEMRAAAQLARSDRAEMTKSQPRKIAS
jgi:glycosyltransferase involved in cell wall biosynthesis